MTTKIDLTSVLEKHGKWLRNEKDGERADLRRANLSGADLSWADLCWADLLGANLLGANLRRADLSWADLRRVDLRWADLSRARLSWQSHALLSEILVRAAGDHVERRMLAGLVAVSVDWCWDRFLAIEHPQKQWAINELTKWVRPEDGAPQVIREAAEAKGGDDERS